MENTTQKSLQISEPPKLPPKLASQIAMQGETAFGGSGVLFPTASLHLACMLWTIGSEPVFLEKSDTERTPQGDPLTRWWYKGSKDGAECIQCWSTPMRNIDWSSLSERERQLAISIVRAFAKNLKYFYGHVKSRNDA